MGSRPRKSYTNTAVPERRTRRRSQSHRNRVCSKPQKISRTIDGNNGGVASVSDKLEALKNLVPVHIDEGEDIKADELFRETADYIVLLRTQILVLQKLINFYGCPSSNQDDQNQNAV
ncbi:hypothetical protein M9H77_15573 [Catharanthus roseus]|uniref:Uncharacterized protein n=1 Tax=Catharanthus roseus TaxID=4058 RepID=A0ACC0AZI7_CATRO|nr:hypothetical protein M9H77_15573 [Catharanthus roseus]